MNRRAFLGSAATISCLTAGSTAAVAPRSGMGLVIHSYAVRQARPMPPRYPAVSDPVAFAEEAAGTGAAGIQTRIPPGDAAATRRLRDVLERHGLYCEGMAGLPRDRMQTETFEATLLAARAAGADVVRTACLSERRYERFKSSAEFDAFVRQSLEALQRAEPLARKHRVRLAVENHKDWRVDEMLPWLRRMSSEYVGVCVDTGNSIALIEDPHRVVEAYAPWAISTHIKDMAVEEYADGFLLAEVPLGEGCLDLGRIFTTLRTARPNIRFNLEMITRDPLHVPCLTPGFWATMGQVPGRELAETLAWVRRSRPRVSPPLISRLEPEERLRAENAHIARSLERARALLQ